MHRIKSEWNDYFNGTSVVTNSYFLYSSRPTLTGSNVCVSNCLFRSFTSTGNGGALCCGTSVTYFLVELTSFISCKTDSQYGGAIYFLNEGGGQSVLLKVCCYDCCSTTNSASYGQSAYVRVKSDALSKNYANYTSITRCVNEKTSSCDTIYHYNGKNCVSSVNISMNKCYYTSGINCRPYGDSNFVTGILSYSSFTDNNATLSHVLTLYADGAKYEIKYCNVFRNTQSYNTNGIITTHGNLAIDDSCILENSANFIFFTTSPSYTITISNCTVDSTANNGYLTIQNTVTKSFIHGLNHMSTRNCHSGYDSVGSLTPFIQPSKKQRLYYTCDNFFNQSRLSNFFSLFCVLLFNFIHQNHFPLFKKFL
jgi:hypothetical protein